MSEYPPIPTRWLKASVHKYAETVAAHFDFNYCDPIEPLIAHIGGKIEYKTPNAVAGKLPESIIVRSPNDFTIYLPSITSVVRDRFTIAHELGHLFLHYPVVSTRIHNPVMIATRWVDENDDDLKRAEWEANWFAAAFLMPSNVFERIYKSKLQSIEATAVEFGVSTKAAEVRAQTLRLI